MIWFSRMVTSSLMAVDSSTMFCFFVLSMFLMIFCRGLSLLESPRMFMFLVSAFPEIRRSMAASRELTLRVVCSIFRTQDFMDCRFSSYSILSEEVFFGFFGFFSVNMCSTRANIERIFQDII